MTWCDVDGAREYLAQGGGKKLSRKVLYNMVAAGLRVSRIGDTGRRLMFCHEWIDEFMKKSATHATRVPVAADERRRGAA